MTARYLVIGARRPGLLVVVALHAALGAAFIAAWGSSGRVPVLPGADLYRQLLTIDAIFVAVAAPWIAARLLGEETRLDAGRLALQYGVAHSGIFTARVAGAAVWVLLLQAAMVPAALEAQQLAGVAPLAAAAGQAVLLGVGISGVTLSVLTADRTDASLARWLFPAAILAGVVVAVA